MKTCLRCKQEQEYNQYSKRTKSKDGFEDWCKTCIKIKNINDKDKRKQYNEKNKDKIKKYSNVYMKQHYQNNKSYYESYRVEYNKDKDKIKENNKKTLNYRIKWARNQYKTNPNFKLSQIIRIRLLDALKNKNNKTESAVKLLGCTIEDFKVYLFSKFKPEMNWENHGEIWEIDHIKPCASFNLTDVKQQQECFHYSNHQPLFKTTEIAESFGYIDSIGNRNKFTKIW